MPNEIDDFFLIFKVLNYFSDDRHRSIVFFYGMLVFKIGVLGKFAVEVLSLWG